VLQERVQACLLLTKVKILYVSQYYPPEMGAPAARVSELAQHWLHAGHDVTVLTGFPNHPTGVIPPDYSRKLRRLIMRERLGSVNVVRTWLFPFPNRKAHERMLNYSSFCVSAASTGIFLDRPDVLIATSPQLLAGLAGWWLSRLKRVPFIFEVRDLWPESLAAVGVGTRESLLHRSLAGIAGFLYRNSEHIVVVSPAFKDLLIESWSVPADKISVVENGVQTELFRPQFVPELRRHLEAENKFVVSYIGTLGMAHDLETVIEAARQLQATRPDILFLFVGEGADKQRIVNLAHSRDLSNVRFIGQQPREKVPEFISISDACLVSLKKTGLFKTVIPTKMLEFMSCARPVLLGVEGQARKILEEAQAGVCYAPGNATALVQAVTALASDRRRCEILGQNGRRHVLAHFSREQTARDYLAVLQGFLGGAQRAISAVA
jgi:colanic acid biosynthesis glycosyl transferase WcaI